MIGELRIGDCRELMPAFPGPGSIDLVLTDPPYLIQANGYTRPGAEHNRGRKGCGMNGKFRYGTGAPRLHEWIPKAKDTLKASGNIVVFESKTNLDLLKRGLMREGLVIRGWGIWVVWARMSYSNGRLLNKADIFVWASKTKDSWRRDPFSLQDVYADPAPKTVAPSHAEVFGKKPVITLRKMILNLCPPGGTVLDPFAGSGSTLRAAREEGRNPYGIEIRPHLERTILSKGLLEVPPIDGGEA